MQDITTHPQPEDTRRHRLGLAALAVAAFGLVASCAPDQGLGGEGGNYGADTAATTGGIISWDVQYTESFVPSRDVAVIALDMNEPERIRSARAKGQQVICYVSVGTAENWRRDYIRFPPEVLGHEWDEWPGERFLDIRRQDILLPIMTERFAACARAGATAISPDNQDQQWAGAFPISQADAVSYVKALAGIAHGMGLQISQNNNPDTVSALVQTLDFMIAEDCFAEGWCPDVLPYARAGKPVYAIEYTDTGVDFDAACDWGRTRGVSFILKGRELSGRTYRACD